MKEKDLNELMDLEVTSPPLAITQETLPDDDDLGSIKDFPLDEGNLAKFKAKFAKAN